MQSQSIASDHPSHDEIVSVIIASLRAYRQQQTLRRASHWEAMSVARTLVRHFGNSSDPEQQAYGLLPSVLDVAWALVRQGILRPGSEQYPGVGHTPDDWFALTRQGQVWLEQTGDRNRLVLEPGSLVRALAAYRGLFGEGFLQRANEATKCRRMGAYLACCAMCGAAAESIVLTLAIARLCDEEEALRIYNSRSGRSSLLNRLAGQAVKPVQERLKGYMELLSYWRDDAAHGVVSDIEDAHAEHALDRLLSLAQFASDHWKDLTGTNKPAD